ncbi:unnamed protein product [marine sediment metagenome]|uniref:Uncharacterized protein n=1 Tax=marine sediment metagenome TaxID=412755 RepID=X1CTY0_9ZZZZ
MKEYPAKQQTDYTTGNKNFEEVLRMERKILKFNLELEKARADKQAGHKKD